MLQSVNLWETVMNRQELQEWKPSLSNANRPLEVRSSCAIYHKKSETKRLNENKETCSRGWELLIDVETMVREAIDRFWGENLKFTIWISKFESIKQCHVNNTLWWTLASHYMKYNLLNNTEVILCWLRIHARKNTIVGLRLWLYEEVNRAKALRGGMEGEASKIITQNLWLCIDQ